MNLNDYQRWASQTSSLRDAKPWPYGDTTRVNVGKPLPELSEGVCFVRVDQGAAGIASEAGEISEHVKHVRFHGKPLDKEHLIKEAGDVLWYLAELATGLGISFSEIAEKNIAKLRVRYPEGYFSVERSETRDRALEDKAGVPELRFTDLELRVLRSAVGAVTQNDQLYFGISDGGLAALKDKLKEP